MGSLPFQGMNSACTAYSVHLVGVAIRPRSDANRWMSKSSNGTCGRSSKRRRESSGHRVRVDRADQLRVDPEPAEDHEEAVLIARLRFADVDRADERPVERRSAEGDGPDLRLIGAFTGGLGAEVGLIVGAHRLAVGGVRVDRQPLGQGDAHRLRLRWRRCEAERLRNVEVEVQPRGAVGIGRRQACGEHGVERLVLASGHRFVARTRRGSGCRGPGRTGPRVR